MIESPSKFVDIPLELVREVSRARAMAEAGHVEGGATTRHDIFLDDRRG
jgi:hypothetical protein